MNLRSMCALFTTAIVGSVTACSSEPIDPDKLSAQTALQARGVLESVGSGMTWTDQDGGFVGKLGKGVDDLSKGFSSVPLKSSPVARMLTGGSLPDSIGRHTAKRPPGFVALTDTSVEAEFDRAAQDIEAFLRDRALVPSNLESKASDHATYLMHADPTCRGLPSSGSSAIDPDCAADLAKLEVRAELWKDGDGGRIRWLLGGERAELFALVVHSDLIAVESDLPETKHAVEIADAALGTVSKSGAAPGKATTKTMVGRVRLAAAKDGPSKVTFSFSVLSAIEIEIVDSAGAPLYSFKTEARTEPVVSATFDGAAQSLALSANVGQTETRDAWDPNATGAGNNDLRFVLGGLTAKTTLSDKTDEMVITGLGLGASTTHIDVRGKTIFALDLNADAMRRFDLRAIETAAGGVRFEIAPKFDLALAYKLGEVIADYKTPPASYLLDETYRFLLGGASKPAIESAAANPAKMFEGGLKVAAGSLTLSSTKASTPVVVPEGKCLTSGAAASDAHPVLGSLRVVDCP